MAIREISISGFRGFGHPGLLSLAQCTGVAGSGLTILVGPNSGGKSTVIESFRVIANRTPQSFPEGRRNKVAADRVSFTVVLDDGSQHELRTVEVGGSETTWASGDRPPLPSIYALPSRRYFDPYFGKALQDRARYTASHNLPPMRGQQIAEFSSRLFAILENRADFDGVLGRVMDPVPDWTIDQADSGQYYLKFASGDLFHSSDGLGEGLVSLFFIVDALYDSQYGQVVVIDEPELSLHPIYQERVAHLLHEYSASRQIVYATHSAHFISFDSVAAGAKVARVYRENGSSKISHLTADTVERLRGFLANWNNPHILGLDARKVFFLDDGVVLVEGQEDVIYIRKVLEQLDVDIAGNFYGWGVGGATNMRTIAAMLGDLGFRRVVGVLDNNMEDLRTDLATAFPSYRFFTISAADIRTKPARNARPDVQGLLDPAGQMRPEHIDHTRALVAAINEYLTHD